MTDMTTPATDYDNSPHSGEHSQESWQSESEQGSATHTQADTDTGSDTDSGSDKAKAAPKPKAKSGRTGTISHRAARLLARNVLATRANLGSLDAQDIALLERLSGEPKAVRDDLDELAVALSAPGAAATAALDAVGALRDLLSEPDPFEQMVSATTLATDHADTFREIWALSRELGLHENARVPAGPEVKAARELCKALEQTDTQTTDRLERLTALFG